MDLRGDVVVGAELGERFLRIGKRIAERWRTGGAVEGEKA
jgi:hypothetical protein